MTECTCQHAIDTIKATSREGIIRELMAQITDKENQIARLERLVDMLNLDLAVARGELNFSETKE